MNPIKQFFFLLDHQAKKAIPFLIIAFLMSSLLDVIGVSLIGVFLGLLTNPTFFLQKLHLFFLLQTFTEKKLIIFSGLLIISAFAFKAVLALFIQTRVIFFCQSLSIRLKKRLMNAFQYAPYTYHLEKNSAHLLSRIQTNLDAYINNVLLPLLTFAANALVAVSILLLLAILHPILTFFLIVMFVLVGMLFDLFFKRKLTSMGKISALSTGEMIKSIHHALYGLTEIRVLGREEYFLNKLTQISAQYAHAAGVLYALQQTPRFLVENMIAIFIIGLSLGGIVVGLSMSSVVAMVGMFAAAGARLLPTATQIISTGNQVRAYFHHTHLVVNEFIELEQLQNLSKRKLVSTPEIKLPFSTISIQEIDYQYPNATHASLNHVSLEIHKGQSIGLIGPSGAGKSSLVNIILGLLEPQQGTILVDGKPIENLRAWLNNFAYIPQTIFLLDDTLQKNIALGIEDEAIDETRIWNAVKMAQLTEVVHQLPQGINTMMGENGVRLSGGQRQRVALARAFYHERDIIVMDEATSSLDHETESEVINTVKRLKGNKTLIVIAHRLTTVEHCDVLYRLDHGRVSAVGSFQEVVGVTN